jgi:hypothetical protein
MVLFQGDLEVFSRLASRVLLGRRWLALATLLFAAACSHPTTPTPGIPFAGEWHTFAGTWSASGTRQTLDLGTNHRAVIFDLTGSLLLTSDRGLGIGFQARAIGFSDNLAGMQGRCVWTDERGDKVYSELKGEFLKAGNRIVGTFVGGTGRYAGITGEFSFQWEYVVESEDGAVSGRSIDLNGRARLGPVDATPGKEHSQ